MSDSESEIDEPKPTRKKIIKNNFSSDSDGSEMSPKSPQPGCSRNNQTKQLSSSSSDCETDGSDESDEIFQSDSDDSEKNDSNWSSYESELDETGVNGEGESNLKNNDDKLIVNDDAGSNSDSSTSGSAESCPICLLSLKNQEIGIPEICEHKFCFICIQEWSNNVTTCPIDRKGFTKIIVKDNIRDLNTLRSVPVEVKSTIVDVPEEDLTQCEVCNQTDREDSMLLCDNCNNGYHMDCLNPPLDEVPFGSWYCDCCFSPHNSEESEDDINALITDAMDMGNLPSSRFRARSNQNAERRVRTRQSQRILSAIISRLARRSYDPDQPSTSNSATIGNQIIRRVRRVATTRKTTKRRKTRKRRTRRTEVIEYEANVTGEKFPIKSKRIYKKRRKTKRKRKTSKKVKCRATSSRRSATNPNTSSAVISLDIKKQDAGLPRLHIFGNHNQLDYFSDSESDGENEMIGRGLGSSGVGGTMLATSVIRARLGGRSILNRRKAINLNIEATPPDSTTSSIDILGDILQTQERWHSLNRGNNLSRVTITNDGSLIPDKVDDKKIEVTEAPMYPRNDGNQGNRFYNNSDNRRYSGGGGSGGGGGGGGNNQRNSYGGADSSGNYNQFRPRQFNSNFQPNNSFGGNDFPYRGSPNRGRSFRGRNSQNPQNQNRFQQQNQQNRQQEATSSNNEQITSSTTENSIKIPDESSSSLNNSELYDPENVELTPPPPAQSQIEETASNSTQNESVITISKADENIDDDDDDDDDDDCPNFSVYSAESMDIAKESDGTIPPVNNESENPPDEFEEKEEDLVQQGDDDDDEEEEEEEEEEQQQHEKEQEEEKEAEKKCDSPSSTTTNLPSIPLPDSEPKPKPDKQKITTEKNKKNILELYDDSDWEEWNNEKTDEDKSSELQKVDEEEEEEVEIEIPVNQPEELATESISDDERSYTPCLDENKQRLKSTDENTNEVKVPEEENENRIFGLDTEMISDEDEGVFNDETTSVQPKIDEIVEKEKEDTEKKSKTVEKSTPPATTSKQNREKRTDKSNRRKDDEFKKLSKNTKERNYRDKDKDKEKDKEKDKSRKRSRSRSNDKENRERRMKNKRRGKRKDLERYDVRNLIADRAPRSSKDEYGRDLSRPLKSKSRSGSRARRSLSNRRRRTISPRRSPGRRGSYSRRRSMSPPRKIRKSRSRRRSPPPPPTTQPVRRNSRSTSRTKIPARKRSRSASLWSNSKTPSLSRSRSNSLDKNNKSRRKPDDKRTGKRKEKKRRTSKTNKRPPRPTVSKVWESPKQQSSWSRSPSIEPTTTNEVSWTPPVAQQQNSENLTVIFKNKEAVAKARKKEKKKRLERKKGQQSRRERKKRSERTTQSSPVAPSKEVFTSGDNILVSVSFNKNQDQPQQTTVVTLPASRDQIITKRRVEEPNQKKTRRNRLTGISSKRHKKIDAKPVAIIDLDNSPFKELTPSPKAIIILSDSENEAEEKAKQTKEPQSKESIIIEDIPERLEQVSQPQSPTIGTTFNMIQLTGPKTPPEPTSVKFSMSVKSKQNKVRPINPLHDGNDDENQIEQPDESSANKIDEIISSDNQLLNKIGPNTPPDPNLNSPDAYDPFEPTKSASNSPVPADTSTNGNLSDSNVVSSMDASIDDNQLNLKDKPMNPVDLVMSLIHNKSHQDISNTSIDSFNNSVDNQNDLTNQSISPSDNNKSDENSKNINVLSQIILQSGSSDVNQQQQQQQRNQFLLPTVTTTTTTTTTNTRSPVKSSQPLATKPSPMKQQTSSNISKLPLPQKSSQIRNTGAGDDMELESPYSPGSSDYDDLFEPPPEMGKNSVSTPKGQKSGGGKNLKDSFDGLFGGSPQQGRTRRGRRQKKQCVKVYSKSSAGNGSLAKDENQLKILDDLPSSAVELQVKDKFLRKLNRQERVVEEVKLVLKPHYNKKHISKEEYKDVLRKAVPKICHNRTGEINPLKIQSLIEAYVKRIRRKSKSSNSK